MGNKNGNTAALVRWRASKTPEELHTIMQEAAKKRVQARLMKQATQTGITTERSIGVTIQLREQGIYVAGSSRSFSIDNCPHTPEAIRQALLKLIP